MSTVFVDTKDTVHNYPTSSHVTRNWDQIGKEAEQEEKDGAQGEAALNQLFQKIYGDSTDEVKKAMNKSFVSGLYKILTRKTLHSVFDQFATLKLHLPGAPKYTISNFKKSI